jgi:hypothetical protein
MLWFLGPRHGTLASRGPVTAPAPSGGPLVDVGHIVVGSSSPLARTVSPLSSTGLLMMASSAILASPSFSSCHPELGITRRSRG